MDGNTNNNRGEQGFTPQDFDSMANKVTKGNKAAGIVIAIILIIVGILMFVLPVGTSVVLMYLASAGFIIYGIYQIVAYARTPHDLKNGWTLANGIIFAILGVLLLIGGPLDMAYTFVFLLAFLALYAGIMQIASYGPLKKSGASGTGWVMASGIIDVILGVLFMFMPFVAAWSMAFILGIYFIMFGIAFFAEAASGHHARKA